MTKIDEPPVSAARGGSTCTGTPTSRASVVSYAHDPFGNRLEFLQHLEGAQESA